MAITTDQLTEATLNGGGIFDVLMDAVEVHLESEFQKGRIRGTDYSQVYLGSMQSVLQQGITFLLQKGIVDADIALKNAQVITEGKQQAVLDQQVAKLTAETALINAQKGLIDQQKVTEQAQTQSGIAQNDSLLGKKKEVYQNQANGYLRDAEQKAAKIMVDAWSIQRTTDEGVMPTPANRLTDTYIGQAVEKMINRV